MGARLTGPGHRSGRRCAVALATAALLAACSGSSGPAVAPVTAEPAVTSSATSTSTPEASTTTAAPATTGAPTTTTTVAPTTTTEPPLVECPEPARPLDEIGAATDDEPAPAAPAAAPVKPFPALDLYVNPNGSAARAAATERDPDVRAILDRLASIPTGFSVGEWFGDRVTESVAGVTRAAAAADRVAVLQIYALPSRDIGAGFSAGGMPDAEAYRAFTAQVVAGIGSGPTVIILEPDSLGQMGDLDPERQQERYQLLNEAVDAYTALPNAWVYLDGTHCGWIPTELNAQRLLRAGMGRAQGFFTNVANFQPTGAELWRAHRISQLTGGAHFVIDIGRNGAGPFTRAVPNRWCNPPDRALGAEPTRRTDSPLADAYLWVKQPGSSDGTCGRGNPPAGTFWTARAVEMARAAGW